VAFSANGLLLAAGAEGGPQGGWLKVWDTTTGKEVPRFPNASAPVAFSPDGRYLVTGGGQTGTKFPVKVWDAVTGRAIHTLDGHVSTVRDVAFAPNGDTPLLASASNDATVRVWDLIRGELIKTLEWDTGCGVACVAFSPNGRLLAAGGIGHVVKIWDTRSWKLFHEQLDTGCIDRLAFHPNDSRVG
jgi:WD40 repeat protein